MASVPRTTGNSSSGKWIARVVITIVSVGGFALVAFIAVTTFGVVNGIEFSPDTFGSREFLYYELPLVRVRVTPVWRERVTSSLQRSLAGSGKLKPAGEGASDPFPAQNPPRWDLVWMQRGRSNYDDDALILYRYFAKEQDANLIFQEDGAAAKHWATWTNNHDELAGVLWPAVAEAARQGLYLFTPALLTAAEQMTVAKDDPPAVAEFEAEIAQVMAQQYADLADARRGEGRHDEAKEFYDSALRHVSDFQPALDGQAKLP